MNEKDKEEINKDERNAAKPYCVPVETSEILTVNGWKFYHELKVGDTILSYNPTTKVVEPDEILELAYFDNADVVEMGHSNWKVISTPNHRWFTIKRRDSGNGRYYEERVTTTEEINSEYSIINSAPFIGGENPITPDDAARLAWLVCDGTYRFSTVNLNKVHTVLGAYGCVIQNKEPYVEELRELFKDDITSITQDNTESACYRFHLKAASTRRLFDTAGLDYYTPDFVAFVISLSREALDSFVDACKKAEGTLRENGEWRISQNTGSLSDAIKLALYLQGFGVSTTERVSYTGKLHQVHTQRKKAHTTAQQFTKVGKGRTNVWCPRTKNGSWIMRQGKVITILGNTFAPLYGGQGANEPPHIRKYFREFFVIYSGHEKWQLRQMDTVIKQGYIETPSGRQYRFPGTKRLRGGRTTNATNIVNYPVQGFATGDIVPLACIRALRRFKELGLNSLLILTVHDSLVVDVYPGELDKVVDALKWAMTEIDVEIKERWDYDMVLPLRMEVAAGPSWGELEEIGKFG